MHETTPKVFLIARPSIDLDGMRAYLREAGGELWLDRRVYGTERLAGASELRSAPSPATAHSAPSAPLSSPSDPAGPPHPNAGELLIEFAGRACYRSWEPGLNPNVSRVRSDPREYFANILSSGHGSVLEHATYTFALRDCSRVLTHELVRHRAGSAFSQESLRYVRIVDIGFRVPPALEPLRKQMLSIVEQLEQIQVAGAKALGIDEQGVPFEVKKQVTSALRRLAPMGISTDIVWSANVRTLRHVIELRTAPGAEEELRLVFGQVARIMRSEAPALFADFARHEDGSWVPAHSKV